MFSIHLLKLKTKISDPTLALANPPTKKGMPNPLSPALQKITKKPTIASIAPNTQVSKAITNK